MVARLRHTSLLPLAGLIALAALGDASAQVKKDKAKETPKVAPAGAAVFEMYQDRGGEYRFRLKSGDTSLAIAGKGYETKDECRKVIEAIQREAARARIVEADADRPGGKAGKK